MLKGKPNLVLVGFMGSGKSSVATMLGGKLGKSVISTDKEVEKKDGRLISQIFEEDGEEYFRSLERQIVKEIGDYQDVIVDCGGGVVLDQNNLDLLKRNGCLIFLAASPEFLYEQIKTTPERPLLKVDDPLSRIKELLEERKMQYKQADITLISEDRSVEEICDEIIELMKND